MGTLKTATTNRSVKGDLASEAQQGYALKCQAGVSVRVCVCARIYMGGAARFTCLSLVRIW